MSEKKEIDMVLMGRAVPQLLRNGRPSCCTAGYSPTLKSLVRLYPVPPKTQFKRWDLVTVEAERKEDDPRVESWKIVGSKRDWDKLHHKITKVDSLKRDEQIELTESMVQPSIAKMNRDRVSLGIIKPVELEAFVSEKPESKYTWVDYHSYQATLFGGRLPRTGKSFKHCLRLKYRCSVCEAKVKKHNQQVLEWETYMWFIKNPDNLEQVIDNYRIHDEDYSKYLLLGTHFVHRSSWMVISILRWKN